MTERELDAIRKSLIHDEAVSNLIWPDFLKEQDIIYNGHYIEDFEEDYSENFEDERKVEIFKQEKKEQKNYTIPIVKFPSFTSMPSVQPMAVPSDHIYYVKPVFGKGKHK